MAGSIKTPGAVQNAESFKTILSGPLGRLITLNAQAAPSDALIKAVWRNEVGTASAQIGQATT